ncbi:MAG: ATP-binding protein [Pseudomonadota bacterium]
MPARPTANPRSRKSGKNPPRRRPVRRILPETPTNSDQGYDASTQGLGVDCPESTGDSLNAFLLEKAAPQLALSTSGKILHMNRAFERLCGALIASGALYLRDGQARWTAQGSSRGEGQQGKVTLRLGQSLETYQWQSVTARWAEKTKAEKPVMLVSLLAVPSENDQITQQKLDRLDDLTRLVSDWIWETDERLHLTYVSHRILEALGYHPQEVQGRPLVALLSNEETTANALFDKDARQPFRNREVTMIHRNGSLHCFRLSGLPIYHPESGRFAGFRGTAEDITSLRSREQALVTAKETAELANRSKTEFLANVSHELRTPLNAVIGFSEVMLSELLGPLGNPQYAGYVQDINDSADHLLKLINDILDVAKIEAGEHRLDMEKASPYAIVESVRRIIANKAQSAGHRLHIDLPEDLPAIIVDERKIKQVLLNLLSNAIKFTPEGGAIRLSARREIDGGFSYVVTDNGIGIAPEDMPRALAPFQQIDSRLSRRFEGTGLGLPLSVGFIELHGGNLIMESQLTVGTTAIARLPARCVCIPDCTSDHESAP